LDCEPARDVDAKRGAEQRRLDIMDRQRIAGEKDLDQTKLDQAREINPGASVHDRRTGDNQDPAARVANLPHLVGDAGDEDLLWFLGRDLTAHEAEDLGVPRALERRHAHTLVADHHLHAWFRVLEDDAPRSTRLAVN